MRLKEATTNIAPAYLSERQLADYLSVGQNIARKVGQQAGARRRIGGRVVYSRADIEQYMDTVARDDQA